MKALGASVMNLVRKPLDYASRHRDALAVLRAVHRTGENEPFPDLLAVARRIGITQKDAEIDWLFAHVRALRPARVLELGTDAGGTFFLWTRAAAPDATLVAVDTRPLGPLGRRSPYAVTLRGFARERQRVELVMPADSHQPATLTRVEALLGAPVDFLFIDGDHSYDGVWDDFRTFSPLVRPGGLVAFHDISNRSAPSTAGVARFWREFTEDRKTDELVADGEAGFGIGLYRVPG